MDMAASLACHGIKVEAVSLLSNSPFQFSTFISSSSARIRHGNARSAGFGRSQLLGFPFPSLSLTASNVENRSLRLSRIVAMVLPTANPESILQGGQAKWSARAIKSFSMAELEARKLKYPTTGTEALLMGMLTEGTSYAARYLRANGVTMFRVREEIIRVLGKADMYFFSPEHPPLTEPAQKALDWAVSEHKKIGCKGEVTATLLLLGLWNQKGSAGQQVLAALGFNEENANELMTAVKGGTLQMD